eukprot:Em0011g782a
MPKFLAQDYLAEALQRRRLLLERMLLTSPNHLEFTEAYVHKGEAGNSEYTKPWLLGFCCALYSNTGQVLETTAEKIKPDIVKLIQACGGKESIELLNDETIWDHPSNEESSDDLFNEIDAAIEKCTALRDTREQFEVESLHHWCLQHEAILQHLLETLECYDHLSFILGSFPTMEDLVQRLKPKMVQDPLLDPTAHPYSYLSIAWSDIFPVTTDGKLDPLPVSAVWETYQTEVLLECQELDPILELQVLSPEPSTQHDVPIPVLPSLDCDDILKESFSPQKMKSFILEPKGRQLLEKAEVMNLSPSPTDGMDPGTSRVYVSSDSADSGVGLGRLESPLLTVTFSPLHSPLGKRIGRLEPLPLPLEDDTIFLSPKGKLIIERRLWEREKLFDSIAAMVLRCPDTEGVVCLAQGKPVVDLASMLSLTPFCIIGDMELELPWDPVHESYKEMMCAKTRLIAACPFGMAMARDTPLLSPGEVFVLDGSIQLLEERDKDPPIEAPQMATDIPSMGLRTGAPPGYLKTCLEPRSISSRQLPSLSPFHARIETNSKVATSLDELSSLDMFMMLRGVNPSADTRKRPALSEKLQSSEPQLKRIHLPTSLDEMHLNTCMASSVSSERKITGPTIHDIELPVQFRALLTTIEELASPLITLLRDQGLHIPQRLTGTLADQMRFFIKQQHKAMEGVQDPKTGEASIDKLFQSCQVAACLYIMSSLADTLTHCSVTTALGKFTSDCEKYEHFISSSLDVLKHELLKFQVQITTSSSSSMVHPKISGLSRVVHQWLRRREEGTGKGKAVVIVPREYPSLSGEIMGHLQSVTSFKPCAFSLVPDETLDPLYLETVEDSTHHTIPSHLKIPFLSFHYLVHPDIQTALSLPFHHGCRFQHYDCLVIPATSVVPCFPWEKVTLLVEYEQSTTTTPLFDGIVPKSLEQYIVLKTVQGLHSAVESAEVSGDIQFTVVASNDITCNTDLLQLLESKLFAYADIIVDEQTGILLRPLSLLSTDLGLRMLVNTTTSLSLQYTVLWTILYCQEANSYQYGGKVPSNLACLHASFANYCPKQDQYEVKVLYATDIKEAAHLIRRVVEVTYKASKRSFEEWCDRDWLFPELTKHERFLLSFPCLNSFSAQRMLHLYALQELLSKGQDELVMSLPWIPKKSLTLFHKMCNTSHSGIGGLGCSSSMEISGHSDHIHTLFGAEPTPVDKKSTPVGVQQQQILDAKRSNLFVVQPMPNVNKMATESVNQKLRMNNFSRTSEVNTIDMPHVLPPLGVNQIPPLLDFQSSTLHQQQKTNIAVKPVKMDWNPGPSQHPPHVISGPLHHPPQVISGQSHHPPQVISGQSHRASHHHPPQVINEPLLHPPQVISGPSHHYLPPVLLGGPKPPNASHIQGFDFPISKVARSNMEAHHHRLAFSDEKADDVILPTKHQSFFDNEAGHMTVPDCQVPFSDSTGPCITIPLFATEVSRQNSNSFLSAPFSTGAHMTKTPSRAPVKSLDLFDSPVSSPGPAHLWTHDRALALGSTRRPPPPSAHAKPLPLPSSFGPTTGRWKLSAQDLKAFHFNQQQQQQPLMSTQTPPMWDLNDAPPGKAVRHNSVSKSLSTDVQVPLGMCTMSPEGVDHTLFPSPNAATSTSVDSVVLSPHGKRLRCEKVPGSSGGQTRLVLF